MLRKFIFHHGLVTDGCLSMDPANDEIIQGVYKKNIREGEERLMLAVLESAVEDFLVCPCTGAPVAKSYFNKRRNGFSIKTAMRFSPLRVSARPSDCIPTTYARA
jgi:hypothetical protein